MKAAIDSAGRVVIPKPLRQRLGLTGGQMVDVRLREGKIEIELVPTPLRLVERKGDPVAISEQALPPLTDEIVRETIERTRR